MNNKDCSPIQDAPKVSEVPCQGSGTNTRQILYYNTLIAYSQLYDEILIHQETEVKIFYSPRKDLNTFSSFVWIPQNLSKIKIWMLSSNRLYFLLEKDNIAIAASSTMTNNTNYCSCFWGVYDILPTCNRLGKGKRYKRIRLEKIVLKFTSWTWFPPKANIVHIRQVHKHKSCA